MTSSSRRPVPSLRHCAERQGRASLLLALASLAWPAAACAHEFTIHTLQPTEDWCEEAHRVAVPGDLLQLVAGRYPGGCDLQLGGHLEENEALGLHGDPSGDTIIDAGPSGVSLRISGDTTRVYQLRAEGVVEVAATGIAIDRVDLACLDVQTGLDRFTMLFSTLGHLELDVVSATLRGNQLGDASVAAIEGLVLENTVHGDLSTTVGAERNLVFGGLEAADATANIVFGPADASGDMVHNTLLGDVSVGGIATNNLTVVSSLPAEGHNVQCSDCFADRAALDLQLGEPLEVDPLPTTATDYCGALPQHVGAVGEVGPGWTVHDRDPFGCSVGLVAEPPEAPVASCPPTWSDTGSVDTGTPVPTDSSPDGVELEQPSGGCHTARHPWWPSLPLLRRRPR